MQQPKEENQPAVFHKFGELVPELRRLVWQTVIDMSTDDIYLVSTNLNSSPKHQKG